MNEPAKRLQHQATEIEMTLGAILVRTDLDQNSVTVGFKPWFEWDVNTEQVRIDAGVIHFIQPDNTIIGLRIDHSSTIRSMSNLLQGNKRHGGKEQMTMEVRMQVPEGERS